MVGAIAANFHEGSRSEYLAQYVFAGFGTAIAIPHQEDSGIDLYCTLTERIGQRAWPLAYFSVQVKSDEQPWVFDTERSVRWFVEYPLPLFLCIVDKSSSRLRLYHTSPRFYAWSLPPLPERLELIPSDEVEGRCTQWGGDWKFSLSTPIVDVSVEELLDDGFHRKIAEVLRFWISYDLENLSRIKTGIHSFRMPDYYKTNSVEHRAWAIQGITQAPDISRAVDHLKETLGWLSSQLHRRGDLSGAVRCALLLRHFANSDDMSDAYLYQKINEIVKTGGYVFAGVDKLNDMLDRELSVNESIDGKSAG